MDPHEIRMVNDNRAQPHAQAIVPTTVPPHALTILPQTAPSHTKTYVLLPIENVPKRPHVPTKTLRPPHKLNALAEISLTNAPRSSAVPTLTANATVNPVLTSLTTSVKLNPYGGHIISLTPTPWCSTLLLLTSLSTYETHRANVSSHSSHSRRQVSHKVRTTTPPHGRLTSTFATSTTFITYTNSPKLAKRSNEQLTPLSNAIAYDEFTSYNATMHPSLTSS